MFVSQGMQGRVLIVAGSDSGGGAGIQADIKTVTCLGGFAATAITALTAQNTVGVHGVHVIPGSFIQDQIRVVMDDLGADSIKIGMLATVETIEAVAHAVSPYVGSVPIVLDPVMIAKGGCALMEPEALAALTSLLVPVASMVTPNLPEAEALTGRTVCSPDDMTCVVQDLHDLGVQSCVLKGGHLPGDTLVDIFSDGQCLQRFTGLRLKTRHTHGTGCTLASAIAVGLAFGLSPLDAVMRARAYVRRALEFAPGLGQGHGPLGHGHTVCLDGSEKIHDAISGESI